MHFLMEQSLNERFLFLTERLDMSHLSCHLLQLLSGFDFLVEITSVEVH